MKKIVNFHYIHPLYYFLYVMGDEELDDFYINEKSDVERLYGEMKLEFEKFGPISRSRVADALEYVLVSRSWSKNWRGVLPQDIPLDDVEDKERFVHDLFVALIGREPNLDFDLDGVEVDNSVGVAGINTRS
ncbi:hypothetical protein [Burkholderia lata]|uniref:hypothetical protein n=1 Tax=Burkholderia lata (strain ATCC 17760 / DSM 23089 / LMG 22485 / NCIMB 9086 / R18194 / 383) TaxID=482957 RepID=UPI001582678E|nr:hypothetical protein [Burkholderia lata]